MAMFLGHVLSSLSWLLRTQVNLHRMKQTISVGNGELERMDTAYSVLRGPVNQGQIHSRATAPGLGHINTKQRLEREGKSGDKASREMRHHVALGEQSKAGSKSGCLLFRSQLQRHKQLSPHCHCCPWIIRDAPGFFPINSCLL